MPLRQKVSALWNAYDIAIWIRAIGTALTSLTNFMLRPFLVLYLYNQLEGSVMLSMMVVGLSPLVGVLVNLLAGGLSDRVGRKPVMLASLILQFIAMLAFTAAGSVWQFALISVLSGIGHALFGPAANAQVSDVVSEEKRPEVFALFHTALNLGAALGPLLGLFLFSWNMHVIFLICAASTAIYTAILWWKVPETLQTRLEGNHTEEKPSSKSRNPFASIRFREHKLLLWITLSAMPITLLYSQVDSTFPLHLQTRFDNYETIFATLMTFNGFVVILLQIWIARKTRDMPLHWIMAASYSLFALVALGYGFAPWFTLLLAVELVFTLGEMLNGPHLQKLVSVIAPPEHRGFYFSIYGMNWQLARGLGPMLGGLVLSRLNGEILFTGLSIIIAAAGVSMFVLAKGIGSKTKEPSMEKNGTAAADLPA